MNKRIQKLRESGIIRSFTVLTDGKKVSKPICAFIMLSVKYGEGIDVETIVDPIIYGKLKDLIIKEF